MASKTRAWLRADVARYWVATGLAVVLTALAVLAVLGFGISLTVTWVSVILGYFVVWILFCVTYTTLTWQVLSPAGGRTLAEWLHESEGQRRSRQRSESLYATGGPSGAITMCIIALAAVVLVAALPSLRGSVLTLTLAIGVVAATWMLLVTVYAVHYARETARDGGLSFPGSAGEDPPRLHDFLYVAAQVATGFNSADVEVRTTRMRREVTIHAVVSFAFNTVVIALLVSLLVTIDF